jgi:hypothetical protein
MVTQKVGVPDNLSLPCVPQLNLTCRKLATAALSVSCGAAAPPHSYTRNGWLLNL